MSESDTFSWKRIFIPAYGPSILFGVGLGAILPVVALSAIELGASPALSAIIVALMGLGSLVSNIPAAVITSRYGERRSLIGASLVSLLALALCLLAGNLLVFALAMLLLGVAMSVFYLARQTWLIEAVPSHMRARALATLGGSQRIGTFIGPFLSAGVIHFLGIDGAYWLASVVLVGVTLLCWSIPELPSRSVQQRKQQQRPRMAAMLTQHRRVFLTLGMGVLLVAALRATRQIAIPLWADHLGFDAATTAFIFGLGSAVDMLVFYPAGKIMDRFGRVWIALPCTLLLGVSFMLIPATSTWLGLVLVSLLMGFGNGIGSGLVMTLGADASPENGRTEFIGIWRLLADIGNSAGPFFLSGVTAAASLGAGIAVTGVAGLVAAGLFWAFLPHRGGGTKPPAPGRS
jgi:MFS family permease